MRWGLRYKIFACTGSLVLGLLVATLFVVGLQADRSARQRLLADLHRTRHQFEALQQLRYQSLLALGRVLSREYALRNAVATYDAPTIVSAMQSFQARIQSDLFFVADNQGTVLALTRSGDHLGEALSTHPALSEALQGEEAPRIVWRRLRRGARRAGCGDRSVSRLARGLHPALLGAYLRLRHRGC